MTEQIVELIRRFAPMSSRSGDWDFIMAGTGKPQRWHEIEDEFRVLIIADPGAGKTFEAQTRACRIKERGRNAFFIRIEKIDANFDQAFEVGTAAEFASWLASTDEASVVRWTLPTQSPGSTVTHFPTILGTGQPGVFARARTDGKFQRG